MQAKMQLAKKNGMVRSGCNRPIGGCWDDVVIRRGKYDEDDRGFSPITARKPDVIRKAPEDRVMAWGHGRKARRLAQRQALNGAEMLTSSIIKMRQ
jgi:hypothetical protein